jgi:hypothetical protein
MATTYGGYWNTYYQKPNYNKDTFKQNKVAAPVQKDAPTSFDYSKPRDYSGYEQANKDHVYAAYLKQRFADPTKLATNQKGETAYDLQRQKVEGDVESLRERGQEELKRRLAASGMDNSGLAFKQNRMLAKDLGEYGGQLRSGIAIEELGAQQSQAEKLQEQAFESEESGKERAEAQRQFDTTADIKTAMFKTDTAMKAWQEGNKLAFDAWVEENGINKDDADRFWDTEMKERDIESGLARDLAGQDFADVIAGRAEGRKAKTSFYFTSGQAGSMTEEQLTQLQQDDPDAWYAYRAGQEGKTVEEATSDNEFRNSIRDSLIVNADDEEMVSMLLGIAKANSLDVGNWENYMAGGGEGQKAGGGLAPDDPSYVRRLNSSKTKPLNLGTTNDHGWHFDSPPAVDTDFSYGGKLYHRTSDPIVYNDSGSNSKETEYMMVEDVETGEVFKVNARGLDTAFKNRQAISDSDDEENTPSQPATTSTTTWEDYFDENGNYNGPMG